MPVTKGDGNGVGRDSMAIGIALPLTAADGSGRPRPFAEVLRDARQAEALGFDSVWVADHLLIQRGPGRLQGMPEALSLLSALAACTERIQLGTLVLCQAFRHPGLLAKMAATIQDISGGRFILGVGAGWHQPGYRAFGLPFDRRVSRLEEYLTVLTDLLRTGRSTFHGRYFQTDNAPLLPHLTPPVWLAARGSRMIALTARFADGWNTAWFGEDVSGFASELTAVRRARAAYGNKQPLTSSVGLLMVPVHDAGEAEQVWSALRSLPALQGIGRDDLARRVLIQPPESAAAVLAAYWEAGADHLIVSPGPAPFSSWEPDSITTLGTLVLPRLRALRPH